MAILKIKASYVPDEFRNWIEDWISKGALCNIVVYNGIITHVHIDILDNGDWSDIQFGSVSKSNSMSLKRITFKPVIVDGKFNENFNETR
jgi:hypothetical protein